MRSILVLFFIAFSFPLPSAATDVVSLASAQAKPLGVETQTVAMGGQATYKGLPALVVVPNTQLRLVSAPLPGVIEAVLVSPGMAVKKGQPLVRLASPQALELQRDLRQTAAQLELARQVRARDETLFQEGLIAEARVQASRVAMTQAEAAAGERRQALGLAGSVSGAAVTLVSPIDGVVLTQEASVGQRVEGATPLCTVGRLSPLWLEIQVPADLAMSLREGLAVRAGGSRGRIIGVGRAVNVGSQTVPVRARMDSGIEGLRPGQTVEAVLELPADAGLHLPATALARQDGRTVVFVAVADGYRATDVKVLDEAGDTVRVEGVRAGDRVAVRGVSSLKAIWTGVGKE